MIKWILILLIIAAVASVLGFHTLAGAAATGAKISDRDRAHIVSAGHLRRHRGRLRA
jgi:hypothetical protein